MTKFSDLINQDKPVLIDFSADWCGPCKMMHPILDEVKKGMNDSVSIYKIDVDNNPGIAGAYAVRSVPTLILFKNGEVVWRQAGVIPANNLTAILKDHLN